MLINLGVASVLRGRQYSVFPASGFGCILNIAALHYPKAALRPAVLIGRAVSTWVGDCSHYTSEWFP